MDELRAQMAQLVQAVQQSQATINAQQPRIQELETAAQRAAASASSAGGASSGDPLGDMANIMRQLQAQTEASVGALKAIADATSTNSRVLRV